MATRLATREDYQGIEVHKNTRLARLYRYIAVLEGREDCRARQRFVKRALVPDTDRIAMLEGELCEWNWLCRQGRRGLTSTDLGAIMAADGPLWQLATGQDPTFDARAK